MADCWLWREAARIRRWTSDATGFLSSDHPHPHGLSLNWAEQRDGRSQAALRHALQPDLVQALEAALGQGESVHLRLVEDLPEIWQRYPFEWPRCGGTPLKGRLLVERWVPKQAHAALCLAARDIAVLNLWPEHEAIQPCAGLATAGRVDVYTGPAVAEELMARGDLSRLSLLAVISHGSEAESGPPFRLEEGELFELPLHHGLPPVVLLVACGNEDGNLLDYGRRLLAAGAQAVVAPVGKLDADAARRLLPAFLAKWDQGFRLNRILGEFHRKAGQERAGWRFCLLGRGSLRAGEPESAHEWPDDRLAEAARRELGEGIAAGTLPVLVERITLWCYQEVGNLETAERCLRSALAIGAGDEQGEPALLRSLNRHQGRLSRLVRVWLSPLLGGLSETYDHALLGKYDRLCLAMAEDIRSEGPAQSHQYLSKIPYRLGHYVNSAEAVVTGLSKAGPDNLGRPRLLGQLLNLLIDLDLPEPGSLVLSHLCCCLNGYRGEDAERQRLNS